MMWLLYGGGVLIGLFAFLIVWGMVRIRQGSRMALAEAQKLDVPDIEGLARECVEVFRDKLDVRLSLDDYDDSAIKLDEAFRDHHRIKTVFEREGFFWYFALPVGAYLGELMRRHARHEWHKRPGEAPHLLVRLAEGESEAYPFEKAVKQGFIGEPGDLIAYLATARALAEDGKGSGR